MYLQNPDDLKNTLNQLPGSAVVLNRDTTDMNDVLPMSDVLANLLEPQTRSFTALVGFFGHRGGGTGQKTLADVILDEAKRSIKSTTTFDTTAFRLAVGVNSSKVASIVSRAWYWLCRYRHEAPNGKAETDKLREAFLKRAAKKGFKAAAQALMPSGSEMLYDTSPFRHAPEEFMDCLDLSPEADEEVACRLFDDTLDALQSQNNYDSAAAILLGFMLQRRADLRINPKQRKDGIITVFHPKMYVVEQDGSEPGKTVSVVGSHNWTESALGVKLTNESVQDNTVRSNVEVATLHADDGHLWSNGAQADGTLGHQVCGTAKELFEDSRFWLGSWERFAPADKLLPVAKLKDTTKPLSDFDYRVEEPEPEDERIPEAVRTLVPHLQRLAERLIGMGDLDSTSWEHYNNFFSNEENPPFGYTPSPYQSDAALRLMSMLGPKPEQGEETGHRGAFLTDETGLGKTIVGKMMATILIVERLKERSDMRQNGEIFPLKASFVVPARLTGDDDQASGWMGHRMDVERAVRDLLSKWKSDITEDEVDGLMEMLDLRVFSIGAFSRSLYKSKSVDKYGPDPENEQPFSDLGVKERVLDDFMHVALSEVILVDESHNFRNEMSRRTRTFRFLASLPLPGEHWAFDIPDASSEEDTAADAPQKSGSGTRRIAIQRRMVCLSATPFNNDVSDLITQMGHFDQFQKWRPAYPNDAMMPDVLREALHAWQDTPAEYDTKAMEPTFSTLLQHVSQHLHSQRQLGIREDRVVQGANDKIKDYGPRYTWHTDSYVDTLKTVQQWAHDREREVTDESKESETSDQDRREAQERMDALLVDLFVQRSRARVLRMAETRRDVDIGSMFRRPHVPRYPIALNEGPAEGDERDASSTFEREVLGALYRLLGKSDEEIAENAETLSFQSYKIAIQRAKDGEGGAAQPNFLGFQLTGLVKRLQSSPYAFFRTIVRGVFRHALTELALVEYMLEGLERDRYTLPENHILLRNKANLENGLADAKKVLERGHGTLKTLATLMGGVSESKESSTYFRSLTGCNPYVNQNENTKINDFKKAAGRIDKYLNKDQMEIEGTEGGWFAELVREVSAFDEDVEETSLIRNDIEKVFDWVETGIEGRSSKGLYKQLYSDLQGHPGLEDSIGEVRTRCVELMASDTENDKHLVRDLGRWAKERIKQDPRLRSLTAWLLIQAQARIVANERGCAPTEVLHSGVRTLLFTEYTDTQEYILATLAALRLVSRPFETSAPNRALQQNLEPVFEKVARYLTKEVEHVGKRLNGWAQDVQQQADGETNSFAKPDLYKSPFYRSDESGEASDTHTDRDELPNWLTPITNPDNLSALADALGNLCDRVGRVCSGANANGADAAHHLFPNDTTSASLFTDSDEVTEEGNDPDTSDVVAENDVVDAFSPWYQVEPQPAYEIAETRAQMRGEGDDTQSLKEDCKRLQKAYDHPVDTLVATQVLAEGVNLQECGVVVHYDLPWNPTRLIQRNGRVDRRINATYENDEDRKRLLDNLTQNVNKVNNRLGKPDISLDPKCVPDFHRPGQIYHMTVVPPEPDLDNVNDDTLVRRVRERIFLKLETIQALFGLSTWPVVLDRKAARKVLSGELDYETPGFRRREDLFAAWSQLREVGDEIETSSTGRAADEEPPQAFVLSVPSVFAERLGRAMAGISDGDGPQAEDVVTGRRSQFDGAGILQSSPYHDELRTVRTVVEANRYKENDDIGFINGVLFERSETGADQGVTLWAKITKHVNGSKRDVFVPVVAEPDDDTFVEVSHINLSTLQRTGDSHPSNDARVPGTPGAMAEDLFVELVSLLLSEDEQHQVHVRRHIEDFAEEADYLQDRYDMVERYPGLRELFCITLNSAAPQPVAENEKPLREPEIKPPPNIWIVTQSVD